MGVLIWRGLVTPKFSVPPGGETVRQTPNLLEVQERARGSLSPYQVWYGSDFTRCRGGEKSWVFLLVRQASLSVTLFLFITLLNVRVLRHISPWRRWNTEMILMPLDRGRFVVVHPCSTFSDWQLTALGVLRACCRFCSGWAMLMVSC